MEYGFRSCTVEDFDFLFDLKKENFKWYVDKIWGWEDEDQKARLKQELKDHLAHKKIILIDNKPIGVYAVHITEDGDLFINEISILKKYQHKGIGRKILEKQLKQNHKKGIRTILQVFKDNPAKKLYEQLGFKVYGETETHYQMEINMYKNIEEIINEYEKNVDNAIKHNSYINQVREYKGYIFKEIRDLKKFENESKWLKKLMDLNYCTPRIISTYNQKIVMEKIEGQAIKDDEAKEHLYNIGQLMANLHNIPVDENIDWKKIMILSYIELKQSVEGIMENDIFQTATNFLEQGLEKIKVSKMAIIHRDLRPENVIYSDGKYYLVDLESMCVGDIDYDFTRMLNLLNQKEIYQYQDFKNLIDGYKKINDLEISEEKWQLYNKFYAFRIYSRMLTGKINRDSKYEEYLKYILTTKNDRVTEWIKRYNQE